jgi:hypothetical protein
LRQEARAAGRSVAALIREKLLDPQGNAVANAQVSLVAENGKQVQTTAGSDGQFAFKGVSRGKYS